MLRFVSLVGFIAVSSKADEQFDTDVEVEKYVFPEIENKESIAFLENFQASVSKDPEDFGWVLSEAEEYAEQELGVVDKFSHSLGDGALVLEKKHTRYGLSKKLETPFTLDTEQLTIQFEARFNSGWTCSGGYLKFVAETEINQKDFSESTPYVLMFGPDKCGGHNKIHVIFRHQNPVSLEWEEKHVKTPLKPPQDNFSHLYTLQMKKSDQSIRVLVDREEVALIHPTKFSFEPAFIPPKEIDDPEDIKPDSWIDDQLMPDPEDSKPSDWIDDPALEYIEDADAFLPTDWDEEEDGPWEAPKIKNPDFNGPWAPQMIEHPDYIGEWKPKKIPNPNYFHQESPLSHLPRISHVFLEVLVNDESISLDNIAITSDFDSGRELAEKAFLPKAGAEKSREQNERLAANKKKRWTNLQEDFGFYSVVEYVTGEIAEFYELHKYVTIISLISIILIPFYYIFIKGDFFKMSEQEISEAAQFAWEERQKKEDAKKKKDDGDNKETSKESKGSEEKKESGARKRAGKGKQ